GMQRDRRLTVPDHVVFEVLDGEAVLLNLRAGTYFGLNPVATRAWELIRELGTLGEVGDAMSREYDVDRELLDDDLCRLLTDLEEKGLLVTEAEEPR
ncbi:MAG: PqqD family protein, partial [Candidatus Binatia bacterium]